MRSMCHRVKHLHKWREVPAEMISTKPPMEVGWRVVQIACLRKKGA
jgi:hypothetical protein